jgi:hypothetical protein
MEKAKLFQYAIIWNPSEEEIKEGKKAVLVADLTTILAKTEKDALIIVSRAIPEQYMDTLNQLEIALRPF